MNRGGRIALVLGTVLLLAHVIARHRNRVRDEWIQTACDDWRAASSEIARLDPRTVREEEGHPLDRALAGPGVDALWDARAWLADHPESVPALVPVLAQPFPVRPPEDPNGEGLHWRPTCGGDYISTGEDLSTRAGRASWLLHQATGRRDEPVVPQWTNRLILADRLRSWQAWLEALDGGRACFPPR